MKFKKNWKRFWTLDRHCAEGFTLVELIVVIAILAILAGVAVPAYSGYVEKANMAADQTLVSEVANALLLQYYSDSDAATGGYVVLSTNGAEGDGVGTKAMEAAFGEGWTTIATLKHDGWTSSGEATVVVNSSFLSNGAQASDLLDALSTLTNAAGIVIEEKKDTATEALSALLGNTDIADQLAAYENSEDYATVASNLLVTYVANELGNLELDEDGNPTTELSALSTMAVMYSSIYSYGNSGADGAADLLASVNEELAKAGGAESATAAIMAALTKAENDTGYNDYIASAGTAGDTAALQTIMSAVSDMADTVTASGSLTDANLYTSDTVASTLDNYIAALNTIANSGLDGAVAVLLSSTGEVSVTPGEAYAAA